MKSAILSRNAGLYSTRRLIEAAEARGHEVHVLDTLHCYMNINSVDPKMHYKGEQLEGFDAVILVLAHQSRSTVRRYCVVEMMGVYPLNESVAISRSRDKLRSMQLMSRKGIGMPVTGFAHSQMIFLT